MRPEGAFVAERALAVHSDRLVRRPPAAGELAADLGTAIPRVEQALAEALTELLGARPEVTCGKLERTGAARLHKLVDAVALNCALGTGDARLLVLSIAHADVMAVTDQVFGGAGERSATRPDRLSGAAELVARRLEAAVGEALDSAFELPAALQPAMRSEVLGRFVSAADTGEFLLLTASVARGGEGGWTMRLMLRPEQAAVLLQAGGMSSSQGQNGPRRPDETPFAGLALPLTAVLAELRMPLAQLSRLAVGDVLPLPTAGLARLKLAENEIARGEIGSREGLLALRLTRIAWMEQGNHDD